MSLNKTRRVFRKVDRLLGDAQAVKNGTFGKRIARRFLGKLTNKLIGKLFK